MALLRSCSAIIWSIRISACTEFICAARRLSTSFCSLRAAADRREDSSANVKSPFTCASCTRRCAIIPST